MNRLERGHQIPVRHARLPVLWKDHVRTPTNDFLKLSDTFFLQY